MMFFAHFLKSALTFLITKHTMPFSEICNCSFKLHRNCSHRVYATDIYLLSTLLKKLDYWAGVWCQAMSACKLINFAFSKVGFSQVKSGRKISILFFRVWNKGDSWNDMKSIGVRAFLSDVNTWVFPKTENALSPKTSSWEAHASSDPASLQSSVRELAQKGWPYASSRGEIQIPKTLPSRDYEAIFKRLQGQKSLP